MCIKRQYLSLDRSGGFTLLETLVFIVIVSIALLGILLVLNITVKNSADPQLRKQALSIAEALMEEVSLARFTYCDPADPNAETATSVAACTAVPEAVGPEAGNARPFDNVNDYVAAYGVAQALPLTDVNGGGIVGLAGYSATITVNPVSLNGLPAADSLRITIQVTHGSETLRLDGYRTRYAPRLMP
jgi:MSHA pilin protein MshD